MPKVICKKIGCKRLVEKGINYGYCDSHKEYGEQKIKEAKKIRYAEYDKTRDKKSVDFYNNSKWKHPKYGAKVAALSRDNYLCQHCLKQGIINSRYLEVHHIVPLKQDYSLGLVLSNLVTLCRRCHKKADGALKRIPPPTFKKIGQYQIP